MKQELIVARLEFLAAFFEIPDQSLLGLIYEGKTPLGKGYEDISQPEFVEQLATTITDLFVNSRDSKPIYPLATELGCSSEGERTSLFHELLSVYEAENKIPQGYPPDHLKVLCEFTLLLIHQNRFGEAANFYTRFAGGWADKLSLAIEERKPSLPIKRLTGLIKELALVMQTDLR